MCRSPVLPVLFFAVFVFDFAGIVEAPYDAAGIAHGQGKGGNIPGDNAAGSYDAIVADGDAGEDTHLCAYPYVVAHTDGIGVFQTAVARFGLERVSGRVETATGADKDIVAEDDGGAVEDDSVYVHVEIFTDFDVVAVIACERLLDEKLPARASQQPAQQGGALLGTAGREPVVFMTEFLAPEAFGQQGGVVVGIVPFAPAAFFFFRFHVCFFFEGGGGVEAEDGYRFFRAATARMTPRATPRRAAKSTRISDGRRKVTVWAGNQNSGIVFLKTKFHCTCQFSS